jgi:glycosyltransferase involved in cell wall biosynthesis
MRIAFILPPNHDSLVGGHTVQRTKTQEYLEARGHQVTSVAEIGALRSAEYDVLHFWSADKAQMQAALHCPAARVATPIYDSRAVLRRFTRENSGNFKLATGLARSAVARKVKTMLGLPLKEDRDGDYRFMLGNCDLFIPNSHSEATAVYEDTGVRTPHFVVPNAVDVAFDHASPDAFVAKYGLRDFVICVGRIEPRKNQLRLIEALKWTPYTLVLVGPPHRHHPGYFMQCAAHFGPKVIHIPFIMHEDLPSAYAAARVGVLPSFYETTGLVSLEAGLAGINVVTTDRGYTREYFEDLVWYCDPASTKSIRRAVMAAFEAPVKTALREKIVRCYTWDITADRTIAAYQRAMELHESKSGRLERKDLIDAV